MRLNRWLAAIGAIVCISMLQVAQRNSVYIKGYSLGDRVNQSHKEQTEVSWLETKVLKLTSPHNLSNTAQERHLKLVAWSLLPSEKVGLRVDLPGPNDPNAVLALRNQQFLNSTLQLADGRDTTD